MQRSGQSVLEYVILLVIIIAALLTMQIYMKRGLQGRWKESVDGLGEQYDPDKANSVVTHRLVSNAESRVQVIPGFNHGIAGYATLRSDASFAKETKNGTQQIEHF